MARPIKVIPSYPPAPQSCDINVVSITSGNISPFTGQGQYYDWQAQYLEMRVNMPPMNYTNFQAWITFIKSLDGQANIFLFGSALQAAYPNDFGSGVYWCLKNNNITYSLGADHLYRLSFEVRQAI